MSELLKKLAGRGTTFRSDGDSWDDEAAQKQWPLLYELLGLTLVEKSRRETGKLTVYIQQGKCFVCVRCPSEGVMAHLRVDPQGNLFDAVEEHLVNDKADWRAMVAQTNGRAAGRAS